jgi:hypothetical protein
MGDMGSFICYHCQDLAWHELARLVQVVFCRGNPRVKLCNLYPSIWVGVFAGLGRGPAGQAAGLWVPYRSTTRMGYLQVLLRVGSGDLQLDKGGLYALEIEAKLLVHSDWPFSVCAYPGLVFILLDRHPSADPRLRKIANSLYHIS